MQTQKFEELGLSHEMLEAVKAMGFEEATPIQSQSINIIKSGRDLIGQSQTGTGKTAAFAIPTLEMLDENNKTVQAIILCPTRELAIQVSEEFRKLLKFKQNLRVLPIYGGQPIDRQIMALKKGVQVLIGTPGRFIDHLNRRTIKTDNVKIAILDEADEMLDMGFREDIEDILNRTPENRQTVLFSATMPKAIIDLSRKYLKNPESIRISPKELTVAKIEQTYYEVTESSKMEAMSRIVDIYNPTLSITFCNTKKRVDELVEKLQARGYFAEGLHGDLKQHQRDYVMKKFREGTIDILVATDVAARGIDVDDVDLIVNYDLPQDEEYYVHRIGRTGRAGRSGRACTLIVGREIYKLRDIMTRTKAKIERRKLPTINEIAEVKGKLFIEKIKEEIEAGDLNKYIHMIEESLIAEDVATLDIAAALLKMELGKDIESHEEIIEPQWKNNNKYDKYDKYDNNRNKGFGRASSDRGRRDNRDRDDRDKERLIINVGKKNKIRPGDIVGAIANEASVPGRSIGGIDIFEDFTFVDVPRNYASQIISKLKGRRYKGVKLNVERASK
ncbi:MAG: DEAD/DEAH box helicase [Defluviitaleaceae bacterium]|nr:DEAD/DEAH box helicase [Defluviitaleaceae bacterium]